MNIVFLSEGYTQAEESRFQAHAAAITERLLADDAFSWFADHINVFRIFVASAESGCDNPSAGVFRNTQFGGYFSGSGIGLDSWQKVNETLAAQIPDYHLVFVLVHTNLGLRGSASIGGRIAVMSAHDNFAASSIGDLALHESGHAFASLMDEYVLGPEAGAGSPVNGINVSSESARDRVPWARFILPSIPVPTTDRWYEQRSLAVVGVFQGGGYGNDLFRPVNESKMRTNDAPWGAVNLRAFALAVHRLNLEHPTAAPVVARPPAGATITVGQGHTLSVEASGTGPISYQWMRDGRYLPEGHRPVYAIPVMTADEAGGYSVEVTNGFGTTTSAIATVNAADPPGGRWLSRDIGAVATAGAAVDMGNFKHVHGSGEDIGGTLDECHFQYQTLTGNGTITARLSSVYTGVIGPKVGVMLRENFEAGSRYAGMFYAMGQGTTFQSRAAAGGATSASAFGTRISFPGWYRVVRTGDTLTGFESNDGATWTQIAAVTIPGLPTTLQGGLAVSSRNDGTRATGLFEYVALTAAAPVAGASSTSQLAVFGSGVAILAGDTTPSPAAGTDFGSATIGGATVTRAFSIENAGTAALTITEPITVRGAAIDYALSGAAMAQTPYTLAPGAKLALTVVFRPTDTGTRSATVTIPNSENGFYNFAIQGSGVDATAPAIKSFTVGSANTAARTVTFTLELTEGVTGVTANSFSLTPAGGATGSIVSVTAPITTPYPIHTVTVSYGGTAGGTLSLGVKSTGSGIVDASGNAYAGGGAPTSVVFTVPGTAPGDTTPPVVVSLRSSGLATRGAPVTFILDFNEPVTGVDAADFEVTYTGSTIARVATVSADPAVTGQSVPSGQRYGIAVEWDGGPGTVRLALKASGTGIVDASGNAYAGGGFAADPITLSGGGVSIANSQSATGTQNSPFNYQIAATGAFSYGLNFVSAPLPPGLSLNSETGLVSGTPAVTGVTTLGIRVGDPGGSANGTVVITINAAAAPTGGGTTTPPAGNTTPPVSVTTPPATTTPPAATVKVAQTITFVSPVSAIMIGQPVALGATSSAGLPITYSIVSGDATLSGNVLTPRSTATLVVRATSPGNDTVAAASVDTDFGAPQKAAQAIALAAMSDTTVAAQPLPLPATTSAGLPIAYSVTGPARLQGNALVLNGAAGTVVLRATAAGNDSYTPAAEVVRTFAVRAIGQQVYFGDIGSDAFAVVISADNTKGVFVTRFAASGEALVARFALDASGAFSTSATGSVPSTNGGADHPPVAALVVRTLSGRVTDGVLTGTVAELGTTFTANVQAPVGATAALAGLYTAATPGSASGDTYVVVSPAGRAYAVAVSPLGVTSGTGTVSSSGEFNLPTANGGTITGTLNASDGTMRGAWRNGANTAALVGLSESSPRSDRIVNLSSRLRTSGEAARVMIAGFVVTGTEAKPMLVRAIGPGLGAFGVQGTLANPRLQIYNSAGTLIAENEDWGANPDVAAAADRVGAFRLEAASRDAAILTTLTPGAYTAQVMANGGNGIALVEVYDAAGGSAAQLVNISTRGFVDSGDGNLIAGFVVTGNAPKRVLIRGVGPSLALFGVTDAVSNPTLKLYAAGSITAMAQNDDWSVPQPIDATQFAATSAEIVGASTASGAFALAPSSRDAAIVITLLPGAYTAVVGDASTGSGTGTALVEVYQLSPP